MVAVRLRDLLSIVLKDDDAERVRRNHADAIRELQQQPLVGAVVSSGVALQDGIETPVAHRLGRIPQFVRESCPRGAATVGLVEVIDNAQYDRSKWVVLRATGWGATITVDVVFA